MTISVGTEIFRSESESFENDFLNQIVIGFYHGQLG